MFLFLQLRAFLRHNMSHYMYTYATTSLLMAVDAVAHLRGAGVVGHDDLLDLEHSIGCWRTDAEVWVAIPGSNQHS